MRRSPGLTFRTSRAAQWVAAVCLAASSGACVLTQDLPDPALDVPAQYKYAGKPDAPPSLDWWRGFRSAELTQLMEEAQTVNLDIAAAVSRIVQADAQARQAGAALLPSLSGGGSETYSRTSGSSASGLSIGGREVVNYSASLSASYQLDFWGQNRDALQTADETANANRFDRDVVAVTTLAGVANAYFQVLASQDRLRTAQSNIASAQRILDAIRERRKAGTGTDLDVAQQESVVANQKALVPPLRQTLDQNVNALAVLVSRPPESVRVLGGSLNKIAIPRVTPGLPSELLTQRPDIRRQEAQLASATANIGNARAQFFPTIQLTGNGGYQSSALVSLFQPHAAFFQLVGSATQPIFDGGKILGNFEFAKARQDELLQTYRKTIIQSFADVDNALYSIKQTTIKLQLQRDVVTSSKRAFDLAEQQLRAGTADIVTVLNVQQTLFQAEDALWQAQLARLLAIVSLYQALGGGWEPRMEKPVNAL
ncbi:efflux transporter outer membrane subunit [Bradyrhizobium japonicum]|uniref:efflux transporter outer membrane subunit n=1 Tax=Bradyrhizobium japonicum TaxID=375 RepID=UPI0020A02AFE|nr:efflux transporter outer membrane subunit [Bradyrhizobium japonicum]MCP1766228.1 NodT family efflux transporter outer membrane factor (OMF) lipoprotein [Bradyrhizobium japonicum]MCP1788366.1 NodT family efflux transporter outer membrane factor (OMF) lipoprotein [Bradyrhizobium japonicum]MCP1810241.1 NodT family efflux transporter outer membrane factor (OMF) lipoprotein [Bradyrhizobium japonicum]MCP1819175.1 NodT family efflux transporter outer membrane factor (OMF) lipoprotein [Bradyrhizobiu